MSEKRIYHKGAAYYPIARGLYPLALLTGGFTLPFSSRLSSTLSADTECYVINESYPIPVRVLNEQTGKYIVQERYATIVRVGSRVRAMLLGDS